MRRSGRRSRSRHRAIVHGAIALAALLATIGCEVPVASDALDSVLAAEPAGVILVLQPAECLSRVGDLAIFREVLGSPRVFGLPPRSPDEPAAVPEEALATLGVSDATRLSPSRERIASWRAAGVTATPVALAWNREQRTLLVVSLSPERRVLREQLLALARVSQDSSGDGWPRPQG